MACICALISMKMRFAVHEDVHGPEVLQILITMYSDITHCFSSDEKMKYRKTTEIRRASFVWPSDRQPCAPLRSARSSVSDFRLVRRIGKKNSSSTSFVKYFKILCLSGSLKFFIMALPTSQQLDGHLSKALLDTSSALRLAFSEGVGTIKDFKLTTEVRWNIRSECNAISVVHSAHSHAQIVYPPQKKPNRLSTSWRLLSRLRKRLKLPEPLEIR